MEFRLLGPLDVVDGRGPIRLGGPRQRTVLALLLLHADRIVPADRLIDEVWGDEPPDAARSTLRTYTSHLRKALGPSRLEGSPPGYVLHADPSEVDAARFESLLDRARKLAVTDPASAADLYGDALALWRGAALEDLADQPSLLPEATRLEELRTWAEEERVAAELVLGRHAEVIPELETLSRRHPLRERLWAHLMVALYRSGRQADALAAFHQARVILADELGIDPSPELRRLHEQILRQDADLEISGESLRGYRILELVGEGSFGAVHRAFQPQVRREVAVKVLTPRLANDPGFIRRFDAEAQLIARLEHPHVVPLYDYWRDPDGAYLVMRFLRGGSLRDALNRGSLDTQSAVRVVDQVALALAAAHRAGIVHRDVKPANILFDEEGNAYLSDFGIARHLAAAQSTGQGSMPSPFAYYLSPEEVRGEPPSPRSDIYSLALVMFESLTGSHPFAGSSPDQVVERHLNDPVGSVRELRPDLPERIDEVIGRATAKDPAKRYPDVLTLSAELQRALGHVPTATAAARRVDRNPYKGLRPFFEADAPDFFGREALVDELGAKMLETTPGSRFLAVVGPSGSGKSSLVRAGLVPALRRGGPTGPNLFVVEMLPGAHPFDELESALLRIAVDPPESLRDELVGDEGGLVRAAKRVLPEDDSELLLVVDQFEEVFTLVEHEDVRRSFLASLWSTAMDPRSRVRVVATLRADFFDRPLLYKRFGDLLGARTQTITALSTDELERAISGPAQSAGVAVDPRVVAEMIAECADHPSALPLLQYALTELFEARSDSAITLDAYRTIGGVTGALARRAEDIYVEFSTAGKEAARQLFLRLFTLGEGIEDVRRRVLLSELLSVRADRDAMKVVIDVFGEHRLLSFDRDPATRAPTVEVAHEALLREWDRLKGWIEAAREDVRMHRGLVAAAREWTSAGRDASFLLRGSRLDRYEAWAATTGLALTDDERHYIDAGMEQREAERAAEKQRAEREAALERRSRFRLRALVTILTAAALIASGLAALAFDQRQQAREQGSAAEEQARVAAARELAAAAVANLNTDPERSVLLALEAVETTYSVDGAVLRQAEEALHRAVQAQRVVTTIPALNSFDHSPDGSRLVAHLYNDDGGGKSAWILDARTGERLTPLRGHTKPIADVAWSPDGTLVATASDDGSAKVWSPENGEVFRTLSGHAGGMSWIRFSPDGRRLATTGADGFVRVWNAATGRQVVAFRANREKESAGGVAWSPEGNRIAVVPILSCCFAHALKVWDVDSRRLLHASEFAPDDTRYGLDVAWSPDGKLIVTTGSTIRGWDAGTGRREFTLFPSADVPDAEFSSDGELLAAAARDGTAEVWQMTAQGPRKLMTLPSSGAALCCLSFSPNGTRLAVGTGGSGPGEATGVGRIWDATRTGGREWLTVPAVAGEGVAVDYSPDGTLVAVSDTPVGTSVRDANTGEELLHIDTRPMAWVTGIDFSPDGSRVATAGNLGVSIWDATTGKELLSPRGHRDWVNKVSFSPDGTRLATASDDGTFKLWDAATGEELFTLERLSDRFVWAVAFSSDGRLLATAGTSAGAVKLWNSATGREERTLVETKAGVRELAFNPDGTRVAAALSDGTTATWELSTGRKLLAFQAHDGVATSLAFSRDGTRIATGGTDGLVKLWDATTGERLLTLTGHEAEVWDVAFNPDDSFLAASGTDGTARVWVLGIENLMDLARARVTRSLTDRECRQYLHLDRCHAS